MVLLKDKNIVMYKHTMNHSRGDMSGSSRVERTMLQQILDMNERVVNINQSISDLILRSSIRQEHNRVYLSGMVPPQHTYRHYAYYPVSTSFNDRAMSEEENNAAAALLNLLLGNSFQTNTNVQVSQAVIDDAITLTTFGQLPEEIRSSQPTCPITHENFSLEAEVALIDGCQHVFKRNAVIRWLRSNGTCPVCRFDIRHNNDTPSHGNNQNPDNNLRNNNQTPNIPNMGLTGLNSLFTFN